MSCSLLYQNYLTPPMLSATSYATPSPISLIPAQTGDMLVELQGVYSGILEADYIIQVQTVGTGGIFNGSTYRWKESITDTWVENVVPVSGVWQDLNNALQIRFTAGTALPYWVLGDAWQARAIRKWGVAKAVDWSRNTEFRSATVADGSTFDLYTNVPVPQVPLALVGYDHNWLSSGTIRLQSSTTSNFASISFNQIVPWQSGRIVYFPSGASAGHYWRLRLTVGTGQGDIRLGEWYLGGRVTTTIGPRQGYTRRLQRLSPADALSILASGQGVASLSSDSRELVFPQQRPADLAKFVALEQSINDWPSGDLRPFYLIVNDADLTDVELGHSGGFQRQNRTDGVDDVSMSFTGLARSLV